MNGLYVIIGYLVLLLAVIVLVGVREDRYASSTKRETEIGRSSSSKFSQK